MILRSAKRAVHAAGRWYIRRICRSEFEDQRFRRHNERPVEYRFALEVLGEYRPKTVLDVGAGTTAFPHLLRTCGFVVTAIDNVKDYWPAGMVNRHWMVLDVDITGPGTFAGPFDAVTCISVLEHICEHEKAMENMLGLLAPGGILVLTCPYNHHEYCPDVYHHPEVWSPTRVPYICQSFSRRELEGWLTGGAELVRMELWKMWSGRVWRTGEPAEWVQAASEDEPHQLGCFAIRKPDRGTRAPETGSDSRGRP